MLEKHVVSSLRRAEMTAKTLISKGKHSKNTIFQRAAGAKKIMILTANIIISKGECSKNTFFSAPQARKIMFLRTSILISKGEML